MKNKPKPLTLGEALDMVKTCYAKALELNERAKQGGYGPIVQNPTAWALYQAWRDADSNQSVQRKEDV